MKNKVAPPFKQCEFDIYYGEGISKFSELIDLGIETGIVRKSGSWFSVGDERVGQGRDNARHYLMEHPDIAEKVKRHIMVAKGLISEGEGDGDAAILH